MYWDFFFIPLRSYLLVFIVKFKVGSENIDVSFDNDIDIFLSILIPIDYTRSLDYWNNRRYRWIVYYFVRRYLEMQPKSSSVFID